MRKNSDIESASGILEMVRSRGSNGLQLFELVGGQFPQHTKGGILGATILNLIDQDLLRHEMDGSWFGIDQFRSYGTFDLREGYEFARLVQGKEELIKLFLTERVYKLQELLGLSITDLAKKHRSDTLQISPLFGRPDTQKEVDVFVIMPFSLDLRPVYEDHILPVTERSGLSIVRADHALTTEHIMHNVWSHIHNAKIVIADCSMQNPNVFYELGIAHTLGRTSILISQSENDVPFDIRHMMYIKYTYTPRGMKEFEANLARFLEMAAAKQDLDKSLDSIRDPY